MTTDTIKITMDLLYRKYLIPMLLFDENGYLIHPKNLEDLPITISTYFHLEKQSRSSFTIQHPIYTAIFVLNLIKRNIR